jgi:proteasome lid subunit RPN8/RPN11
MTKAEMWGRFDLDGATVEQIVEHGHSDFPYEVCGLLAGQRARPESGQGADAQPARVQAIYRVPNASRSMTSYSMEPKAMLHAFNDMDDRELDLLAIYHTHTHTEAFPSPTDVELATYPDAVYLICSLEDDEPVIRAFDIVRGKITERTLQIDGRPAAVGAR